MPHSPDAPGAPEAVRQGCKCSAHTNREGDGAFEDQGGRVRYVVEKKCPMHGEPKKKRGAA